MSTTLSGMQSTAHRTDAGQLVDLDGLAATFHRRRIEGPDFDEAFDQVQGRRRDQHRPRKRELLHARGEMRRLTDRRVVHVQVTADRADHDFAGVEADTDLHGHAVCAPRRLGVLASSTGRTRT